MAELQLVSVHDDGKHLILAGPDGKEHRLPIDDQLRAAVRRARPRVAPARPAGSDARIAGAERMPTESARLSGNVSPRQIQSRLRAGETATDIARDAELPVERIRRFESPVAAERSWVAEQGRKTPLRREPGAPTLGEVVVDRLARRGVETGDLTWSATRHPGENWELVVEFSAGDRDRHARWSVDLAGRAVHALDDESRWLSEADLSVTDGRPPATVIGSNVYDIEVDLHNDEVAAVQVPVAGVEAQQPAHAGAAGADSPTEMETPPAVVAAPSGADDTDDRTAEILKGLAATRGIRQEIPRIEEHDEALWEETPLDEPPSPQVQEPVGASVRSLRPGKARGRDARDRPLPADADTAGEGAPEMPLLPILPDAAPPEARPKSRSRRTSVPSWDEIVFGAKPE